MRLRKSIADRKIRSELTVGIAAESVEEAEEIAMIVAKGGWHQNARIIEENHVTTVDPDSIRLADE